MIQLTSSSSSSFGELSTSVIANTSGMVWRHLCRNMSWDDSTDTAALESKVAMRKKVEVFMVDS
jgi:hypothetical protein